MVLFGGKQQEQMRFCNDRCLQQGTLLAISRQVPDDLVRQSVGAVHRGLCPQCNGSGPVDVHVSHRVWSALLLTSWVSRPQVSCRACGVKRQLGDAAFSLVLGWWGLPWGLIMTPVQVGRNLVGLVTAPDPSKPSAQLEKLVRLNIAAQAAARQAGRADA
jgi:hypothetical protein